MTMLLLSAAAIVTTAATTRGRIVRVVRDSAGRVHIEATQRSAQ